MTNCIFYSLFFVLFLNVSFGSLRFSQIHRNFMCIYKGMLEASVMTLDKHGEPVIPYYNQGRIVEYSNKYLKKNISRYSRDYTVTINFFDKETSYLCDEECNKVKITLKAKINILFNYDKYQIFTIRSKEEL